MTPGPVCGRPGWTLGMLLARTVETPRGCLEWAGFRSRGYGKVRDRNKKMRAHRLAWELAYGPVPPGLQVLHICDNPPCVNPEHLFLGTIKDNVADAQSKGRFPVRKPRPEPKPATKLTPDLVLEIRASKETRALARRLGVDRKTIKDARAGRTWGWVTPDSVAKKGEG